MPPTKIGSARKQEDVGYFPDFPATGVYIDEGELRMGAPDDPYGWAGFRRPPTPSQPQPSALEAIYLTQVVISAWGTVNSPPAHAAFASSTGSDMFALSETAVVASPRDRFWGPLHPTVPSGGSTQAVEGDARSVALRVALQSPSAAAQPFIPAFSDNPAVDLRDWTGLTTPELASMSGVTERAFLEWIKGSSPSAAHESRLLGLRYFAQILAATLGIVGTRRWLRAPHLSLNGQTPLRALADGRDGEVRQLVERYLETSAT